MTAVIDASALVAFCLNESGLDRKKLQEHLRNGVLSFELIRAESANAILVARRRGIVDEKTAKLGLANMLDISENNIKMMAQDDELISVAFDMAGSNNLAIYDLLYLSLAKKNNALLLSKDENQTKLAMSLGIGVGGV